MIRRTLTIATFVIAGGLWFVTVFWFKNDPSVIINAAHFDVTVADTPAERAQGLSGQASLDPEVGMLFVFPEPTVPSFWMPDMHFPLDIIWIDTDGAVVGFEENVQPLADTDEPMTYSPPTPVPYVLEVNAGTVAAHGMNVDDPARIDL